MEEVAHPDISGARRGLGVDGDGELAWKKAAAVVLQASAMELERKKGKKGSGDRQEGKERES